MAADNPTTQANSDWSDKLLDLPVTRWLAPLFSTPAVAPPRSLCRVEPLAEISDPEALEFEKSESPDTAGLAPAMTRALAKFELLIRSAGGRFELKSAYRPEAYQEHLQQVWLKWIELRYNHTPGCQALRAEVSAEFTNHHLMESQKPVTSSDHTRGLAFDAAIQLPRSTKRRRVSLDRLALLAGIVRPDIRRDPVHFKLVLPRGPHSSSTD